MLDTLNRIARRSVLFAESVADRVSAAWHAKYGWRRPVIIEPYLGWGPPGGPWRIGGRVLVDPGVHVGDVARGPAATFVDMIKRYWTREVAYAVVEGTCAGRTVSAVCDKEGYFDLSFNALGDTRPGLFAEVALRLVAPTRAARPDVLFRGRIQAPSSTARYGIISDVDDTIVRTGATTLWRHAYIVLFNSAHTRVPFPGVSALYRAMTQDAAGVPTNPIWYLTSSPWNLYGLFVDFMRLNDIPLGTLVMKRFGVHADHWFKSSHLAHKRGAILALMEAFPDLQFVLIGDSGQQDAEIYTQIASELPHRVLAIYLRHVAGDAREAAIAELFDGLSGRNVPVILTEDTEVLARHAAARGWLPRREVTHVAAVAEEDRAQGTMVDDMLDAADAAVAATGQAVAP